MPELVRSIANRLREFVINRRYAARYRIRLDVNVSILDSKQSTHLSASAERPLSLEGYTYDISSTGLAIIVPAIRIGERYLTGEGRTLIINLKFPDEPMQIEGTPVRYERYEEEEITSYFIGIHITAPTNLYRTRFIEYMRTKKE